MALPQRSLPLVGEEKIDAYHRADESAGYGQLILDALQARGYSNALHISSGYKARLYKGQDPHGRAVAIRVQAPFAVERKRREKPGLINYTRLKLLHTLLPVHPNIVRFRETGLLRLNSAAGSKTLQFAVMDFIDGETLMHALESGEFVRRGVDTFHATLLGVLQGWSALHRRGLRYGDIWPSNIMLQKETWNPVLIDLNFSLRFFRKPVHEHRKFRASLRGLLLGRFVNDKEFSALDEAEVLRVWSPPDARATALLKQWIAFEQRMDESGDLYHAPPVRFLQEARAMTTGAK